MKAKNKLSRREIRKSIRKPALPNNKVIQHDKSKNKNRRKIKENFRKENVDLSDLCG